MTTNTHIAAVVICYHPERDLLANIKTYAGQIDKVFVCDNTEKGTPLKGELLSLSNVVYLHDGKNEGIARRLNQVCQQAIAEGYAWLLTMDQDTAFSENQFDSYLQCFQQFENKKSVSLFCTTATPDAYSGEGCYFKEAEDAITSGTLLNLSLFEKVGGFDEKLFIDSVDHDYLIRSRLQGFTAIEFSAIVVRHQLGQEVYRSSIKTLFLRKKKKFIHSPLRCYYMYRNLLYLEQKFNGVEDPLAKNLRKIVIGNLKNNLFYGRRTWQTIESIVLAYYDFKKGRMGKRN